MEAMFAFFFQRAGGCCKPVEDASGPLFGAAGESRRVIAFILCFERPFLRRRQIGWYRGSSFRPMCRSIGEEGFFIPQIKNEEGSYRWKGRHFHEKLVAPSSGEMGVTMLDMKFLRTNPELVKENIRKKFQENKLSLVDDVIEKDQAFRNAKTRGDYLRSQRNAISKGIGQLMAQGKKDEAEEAKKQVSAMATELSELEILEEKLEKEIKDIMIVIPNIIDPSVPIGKDDTENVEVQRFGEARIPDFDIPYHVEIMEKLQGIELESARKTSGNGFYYLKGDIARLHSAILSYARDFMIDRGFTYYIPPFMIRSEVVTGVMSFSEMENMMYKIEGEDLYLIGTSEHSMIGKFIDSIVEKETLPQAMTSYSPCFRKEVGAHGIEERGVYRIHQFEKQEMVVVCEPEDSPAWFEKMYNNTIEFFRSLEIPVRTIECCSGDLADLKVKSIDVEAWSPRQQKYFEVGSCSNLGDAQARRLGIRIKGKENGGNYFAHTLNNTVVAPPRMLISFLENHVKEDGSVFIPEVLRMYMGGKANLQ